MSSVSVAPPQTLPAGTISDQDVFARFGWTEDVLSHARGLAFPEWQTVWVLRHGSTVVRDSFRRFRVDEVDEWLVRLRKLSAAVLASDGTPRLKFVAGFALELDGLPLQDRHAFIALELLRQSFTWDERDVEQLGLPSRVVRTSDDGRQAPYVRVHELVQWLESVALVARGVLAEGLRS